jgi:hypothetical protein
MTDRPRLDVNDVDARVWACWEAFPAGPLPPEGRERDLIVFLAGVKAVCVAFGGAAGDNLADHVAAGVLIRDAIASRIAEAEREGGPGIEPDPPEST